MSAAPLTQAVTSGDAGAVKALLANGASANERTSGGQTPLILATIFGHTHLIPLLLNAGADPELRDNLGLNALDWAQRRGATEAIALFSGKQTSAASETEASEPVKPTVAATREENEARGVSERDARPVSEGERSKRWLAGLKQRIAEESHRETADGANIFTRRPGELPPAQAAQTAPPREPEPQIKRIEEPKPISEPPRREPARKPPQRLEPERIEPLETERVELSPPSPAAQTPQPSAAQSETVDRIPPETIERNPPPKAVRKRCPQCGAIYNSSLLAYCAHHVVPLVDADAPPIFPEPPKSSPVLFWALIVITLTGSLVIGSLVTTYLYGSNRGVVKTAAPPAPKTVQRGIPLADPGLEGTVVSLPVAECPLKGQEAIPGTVVVRVVINKDGQVTSARASGGDWLLRGAASEAAMKSTFAPDKLHTRETEGTITYTFEP